MAAERQQHGRRRFARPDRRAEGEAGERPGESQELRQLPRYPREAGEERQEGDEREAGGPEGVTPVERPIANRAKDAAETTAGESTSRQLSRDRGAVGRSGIGRGRRRRLPPAALGFRRTQRFGLAPRLPSWLQPGGPNR